MKYCFLNVLLSVLWLGAALAAEQSLTGAVTGGGRLRPEQFQPYIDRFNAQDEEVYPATIRNTNAWAFLRHNVPWFECPDRVLEEIYYFRWWAYRKHLKETPEGYIVTEFLPDVPWAGKRNSINCAAGHHFYEGRWLHDRRYLDDYAVFWLRKGGSVRTYSFWIADSLWNRYLVSGDSSEIRDLFPELVANYHEWEKSRMGTNGLFWQVDGQDGMEVSIGGSGYRATINSYMFADAQALASIAGLVGQTNLAREFQAKALKIRQLVQTRLWNPTDHFFETLPQQPPGAGWVGVRELHGYTPWYANLPEPGFEEAWKQIVDPEGFAAPFGPTTAERRSARFELSYQGHECQWNGPGWPYATSVTLTAMANLLNNYQQQIVRKDDYLRLLQIYARSQHLQREEGKGVPWIDENLNPLTGDWMARTIMKTRKNQIYERGKDYNHSTFCDLIINGLVGLRPRADDRVEVNPLVPEGTWSYFCLDQILYHGHELSIVYDASGRRYHKGRGLRVLVDGVEIARSPKLRRLTGVLPKN